MKMNDKYIKQIAIIIGIGKLQPLQLIINSKHWTFSEHILDYL